jgi:type VI secretion system protein ImpH
MADDAGQSRPDLAPPPEMMDAYALLRRLERDGRRFGGTGRPEREPARLGQTVRLAFATTDVTGMRPATDKLAAKVTLASIGLLGPEGPMPLHLTRWVLDRLSQRWYADGDSGAVADSTFADFADILQHRMIALHYRAWADNRPEVQAERPGMGRIGALIGALAGLGLPATEDGLGPVRRRHAAALGHQVEGPERLTRFLADAFGMPVVLGEFAAHWLDVPPALQTRLGRAHAGLGRGAALGPRSFQRQTRIELRVGPLARPAFEALLPGTPRLETLRAAARGMVGTSLGTDLRLVLARDEVPAARIGAARLGRTSWLSPTRRRDADDLRLHGFLDRLGDAA